MPNILFILPILWREMLESRMIQLHNPCCQLLSIVIEEAGEMSKASNRPAPREGMLNVDETAEALGIKPATVRSWILRRAINFTKIGRAVRISPTEVQRIIKQGAVPAQRRLAS